MSLRMHRDFLASKVGVKHDRLWRSAYGGRIVLGGAVRGRARLHKSDLEGLVRTDVRTGDVKAGR